MIAHRSFVAFSALLLIISFLFSCSAPVSENIRSKNIISNNFEPNIPEFPSENSPYFKITDLLNTKWQTDSQDVVLEFGPTEYIIVLSYKEKNYTFTKHEYYDGVFRLETDPYEVDKWNTWTLTLCFRPQSETKAWFQIFGGTINKIGTLTRVK